LPRNQARCTSALRGRNGRLAETAELAISPPQALNSLVMQLTAAKCDGAAQLERGWFFAASVGTWFQPAVADIR